MLIMRRTREQFEAFANEARSAFYKGQGRQFTTVAPVAVKEERTGVPVKHGTPCETQNEGWVLAKTKKALSIALVLASPRVPDDVCQSRMAACRTCEHCTQVGERHLCECCGCPAWNFGHVGSYLEYKNTKAAWMCPRAQPAFGAWQPDEGEKTTA